MGHKVRRVQLRRHRRSLGLGCAILGIRSGAALAEVEQHPKQSMGESSIVDLYVRGVQLNWIDMIIPEYAISKVLGLQTSIDST